MNYQEENSSGRSRKPDDGMSRDQDLKNLLDEWRVPEPTAALGERVFSDYRRHFHHEPWWRRWLTGSIRLPVPVAAMMGLLLCAASYLGVRKTTSYSIEVVQAPRPVKVVKVPIPVIQEKIVTRVVYKKAGPQKVNKNFTPDYLSTFDESEAIAQADLTGFRPVSEIKIIVSKGGQEE